VGTIISIGCFSCEWSCSWRVHITFKDLSFLLTNSTCWSVRNSLDACSICKLTFTYVCDNSMSTVSLYSCSSSKRTESWWIRISLNNGDILRTYLTSWSDIFFVANRSSILTITG
jgi:hypothetical protein